MSSPPPLVPLQARGQRYRRVVVLTGAGVSVPSGLRAYRGPGGLWEEHPELEAALTAGAEPGMVWRALAAMRPAVCAALPNASHLALAEYERRVTDSGGSFTLITQNIDGLHQRAGSRNVIELHGNLLRTRCTSCSSRPFRDDDAPAVVPSCKACGQPLRADVVLFNEPIGAREEVDAKRSLRDCDLFIAVGTSGTVSPASNFVRSAEYEGAHTIYVNLTPMKPPNPAFLEVILGEADRVLPDLFGP